MIVKNEEKVLPRILKPMKEIVDKILICDTGSTDRTKEIIREFTAEVYDFPWKNDFSAARNFISEKVSTDYWMWLDADDMITQENLYRLKQLKETLSPNTDMVMMDYVTDFDEWNHAAFSCYRERILKTSRNFRWRGRVHESIIPTGNILYSPIQIEHRKIKPRSSFRNLHIYQQMIEEGETLEPRDLFYYGRELFYHKQYEYAICVLKKFLKEPDGWIENRLDSCLVLSYCYQASGNDQHALEILFHSFISDIPRAEICCEIGKIFFMKQNFSMAAHWYHQALLAPDNNQNGGFYIPDCHNFIPFLQLCVCLDKSGMHKEAFEFHRKARTLKPEHPSVIQNQIYFHEILGF